VIKKIALFLCFLLLFSCKHKQGSGGSGEVNQKRVYIKKMSVTSEAVNLEDWKVTIPYTSRALGKNDFNVVLSESNVSFSISPLPLKIGAGGNAKIVVTSTKLSQEIEVSMRKNEHTVNFKKPETGYLSVLDEENKTIATGATVSDATLLTLQANPPTDALVVDYYKINGKKRFWGKGTTTIEVKEDLNIEVFFIEKHRFSFVSVIDEHLTISKDKWLDYLDWEDYPDIHVEPFAMGRTEVPYPVWKEIRDWAKTKGYYFTNEGQNGSHYVSSQDSKPFDENDGKLYPAVKMNQLDMWAWCNASVDYMNEKHKNEEDYVPLTYVYKFHKNGEPLKDARVDFPVFSSPVPADTGLKFQKVIDFVNSITIDRKATGYRLPTRFEWIVAGRGGDPNAPAWEYRFPGSNNLDDVTFYHVKGSTELQTLHPICSKKPNTLGLYDIVGNADEWIDTRSKSDPLRMEVIGNSSCDDVSTFGKYDWYQEGATGVPNPWGGAGQFGGGTYGYAPTGFRLAFSLK
jgi:hypothetical protein bfra3_19865